MKSHLLLTGFAPFQGEAVNPSQKLVEHFAGSLEWRDLLRTRSLPVSFVRAFEGMRPALEDPGLRAVVMLGQAAGRSKICLERTALNWIETANADEDGFHPRTGAVRADVKENALMNELPLGEWAQQLQEKGIPTEVSFSAGAFVCNDLSFKVGHLLHESDVPWLFVHVPMLPEQTQGGDKPSLSWQTQAKGVEEILRMMSALVGLP